MFWLDPNSGVPLYVQLQQQIQQRILAGQLADGAQLPSVRELSARLHLNPLTVAKVYQRLEHDGFVETRRGLGTFVAHQAPALRLEARRRQLQPALERLAAEAAHLGLSEKEVHALLSETLHRYSSQR